MASDDARRTALPDLKRPSLTKWLSDEILHRLPPFLESSRQHVDPQMPYVGPAHSHLSSPCPATLSFRNANNWILAAATAAVASTISRPVVPSARTGQMWRLLLTAFPHSSMVVGAVILMASRVEEGMSCKGSASRWLCVRARAGMDQVTSE